MIEAWLSRLASWFVAWLARTVEWRQSRKRLLVIACDATLAVVATWVAFSLRLGEWRLLDWPVVRFSLTVLAVWFPIALYRNVYDAIFRYAGRGTIISLAGTMLLTGSILVAIYSVLTYPGVPRTVAILQPILFFMMISTARIVGRYVLVDLVHARPGHGDTRRVLIYGAGATGRQLASSLAGEMGTQLVGFVDDNPALAGRRLDGVPVWSSDFIEELLKELHISDVLLALRSASFGRRQEIVHRLEQFSVNVKTLPPIREILDGHVTVSSLRPIEVEDILGRDQVKSDEALLKHAVTGKVVMITGAGGSIGSEIARQVLALKASRLVLLDASEFALFEISEELKARTKDPTTISSVLANVADAKQIGAALSEHRPETLFHAAAFKHVPLLEANVVAGTHNNIFGTLHTALAAETYGVERFVLISTDKAVRPPNVMGASKRCCELVLQALAARGSATVFGMVRFGNVLNSSGSVVPRFRKQIAAGGPVTVTHRDITRYFMTIPEAAELVIQAGAMATGGEVFVLDMGEPVKLWDLATSMIRLAGLTVRDGDQPSGDIQVVETGLRPGEKLFEELLIGDNPLPTAHPRIKQARETFVAWDELATQLKALEVAVNGNASDACREILKRLVPTLPSSTALTGPVPSTTTADDLQTSPQAPTRIADPTS